MIVSFALEYACSPFSCRCCRVLCVLRLLHRLRRNPKSFLQSQRHSSSTSSTSSTAFASFASQQDIVQHRHGSRRHHARHGLSARWNLALLVLPSPTTSLLWLTYLRSIEHSFQDRTSSSIVAVHQCSSIDSPTANVSLQATNLVEISRGLALRSQF